MVYDRILFYLVSILVVVIILSLLFVAYFSLKESQLKKIIISDQQPEVLSTSKSLKLVPFDIQNTYNRITKRTNLLGFLILILLGYCYYLLTVENWIVLAITLIISLSLCFIIIQKWAYNYDCSLNDFIILNSKQVFYLYSYTDKSEQKKLATIQKRKLISGYVLITSGLLISITILVNQFYIN